MSGELGTNLLGDNERIQNFLADLKIIFGGPNTTSHTLF